MVDGGSTCARDYRPSIWSGPVSLADTSITYASHAPLMRGPTHRGMANHRCGERIRNSRRLDKIRRSTVMCASSDSDMRYTGRHACDSFKSPRRRQLRRPSSDPQRRGAGLTAPLPGPHSPQGLAGAVGTLASGPLRREHQQQRPPIGPCTSRLSSRMPAGLYRSVANDVAPIGSVEAIATTCQTCTFRPIAVIPAPSRARAIGIRVPVMQLSIAMHAGPVSGAHGEPLQAREHLVLRLLVQGPPAERLDVTGDQVRRRAG